MSGNGGFQEKALQNRSAIAHISPTSNERMSVRTKTLDGRAIAVPPHQVAVLSEQPKVVYVNPQTAVPSAWGGSETFVDFQIPPELHILTGLQLRMPITVGTAAASLPATPYWISRIEVQAGKDTIETLYPEHLYHDAIGSKSVEQNSQDSTRFNLADVFAVRFAVAGGSTAEKTGTITTYASGAAVSTTAAPFGIATSVATGTYDGNGTNNPCFYLPIHCSLTQGKVFVSGFITPFRLRIYFPSAILCSTTSSPTVVLNNSLQLWCEEQELSSINYEAKLREHRNGQVSYKCVIKDRYVEAQAGNLAASTTYNTQLKAFKSLSAGLMIAVKPQGANVNNQQLVNPTHLALDTLELRDNVGRRMTETLRSEYLRDVVFSQHFDGNFAKYIPLYFIPFSSDLGETLKNGVNLGYEQLTTLEQLIWTTKSVPDTSTTENTKSYNLAITSFNYALLECSAGVPRVVFT